MRYYEHVYGKKRIWADSRKKLNAAGYDVNRVRENRNDKLITIWKNPGLNDGPHGLNAPFEDLQEEEPA